MPLTLERAAAPTRRAFAERMAEYGALDEEFVVFEADIGYSTYSCLFGQRYPHRYFNMGIAEGNTLAAAAGMAAGGRTVVACSYGVFITLRAVEAVRTFICYPNLNVKFLSSHGGITAAIDGVTHQATEDLGVMTTLPNMKVLVPADTRAAQGLFDIALATPGPVFVRLMRDPLFDVYDAADAFRLGGSHVLRGGTDITIVSYGDIVFQALAAAERLATEGLSAEVIDMYSVKPFDRDGLLRSIARTGALLVAENHQRRNGLGYELSNFCLKRCPVPFENLGLDDTFAESGDYPSMIEKYGISAAHIAAAARELVARKRTRRLVGAAEQEA
ncbi:MAG: transketolase family protein [Kiritimatiellae bacterium]|nr:transketolase family protein [Kiritimatiellia bacterium]